MNNQNEPRNKKGHRIQFSIMSPKEIRDRSVVEVTKHDTFDKDMPLLKVCLIFEWVPLIWENLWNLWSNQH